MKALSKFLTAKGKRKQRVNFGVKDKNRSNRKRIIFQVTARHLYAQIVDDEIGKTMLTVSTLDESFGGAGKSFKSKENAVKLAALLEAKLKGASKTEKFVFDRGPKLYHGRVKAFAEALREKGFNF